MYQKKIHLLCEKLYLKVLQQKNNKIIDYHLTVENIFLCSQLVFES